MDWLIFAFFVIFGFVIGSFLDNLAYRLPNGIGLFAPVKSHCEKCNTEFKWYEKIPVLSFVFSGGRCRRCRERLPLRTLLLPILNAALYAGIYLFFKNTTTLAWRIAQTGCTSILSSVMLLSAVIDAEHKVAFDIVTGVGGAAAILYHVFGGVFVGRYFPDNIVEILLGLGVGLFAFAISYFFPKFFLKKAGFGGGDVLLGVVIALYLGIMRLAVTLFVTAFVALFASIISMLVALRKHGEITEEDKSLPFIPFMTFGFFVGLFVGQPVAEWAIEAVLSLF